MRPGLPSNPDDHPRWLEAATRGARIGAAVSAEKHRRRHEEVREEVVMLLEAGESAGRIAARLGTTAGALERRFYRRGEFDLAKPFNREVTRQRAARREAS